MEYRVDILIVGAGIAGLRCGIELLNQNPKKTVLILEKYNYSGGRVVTYSTDIDSKKYQWENGAGRISDTHLKVHDLLNKYGLETISLSKTQLWIPTYDVKPEENPFDATMEVMLPIFQKLQPKALANHTLMELSVKLLGPYKAKELFEPFPYRAEVNTLRADLAIESFSNEMGPGEEFSVVKTGLTSLIDKMVEDFKKKHGVYPSYYGAQSYDAIMLMASAAEALKGDLSNKDKVRAEIKKANFKSVRGDFKFGNNNFPIENFYIQEAVKDPQGMMTVKTIATALKNAVDPFAEKCPMK